MKQYDVEGSNNPKPKRLTYNIEGTKKSKRLTYDLSNQPDNTSEYDEEKAKKIKKLIKFTSVAAAILVPCIIFASVMYNGYVKTNKLYAEVEREYVNLSMSYVTEGVTSDDIMDGNLTKKVDFEALQAQESDVYAWISIPETPVDYPILQSGEGKEEDYWLNHNLDGSYGYPGTIFTERMFGKDFKSFNTVIYGHNMKNQTMFGVLHNYSDVEYCESHQFAYIYTPSVTYKYRLVSVSTVSDAHLAIAYNGYNTEQQRRQFLDYLRGSASYTNPEVETDIYDSYITLSTCTDSKTSRYVVLMKCVDKVSNKSYD